MKLGAAMKSWRCALAGALATHGFYPALTAGNCEDLLADQLVERVRTETDPR
jgi:hypothetical protein